MSKRYSTYNKQTLKQIRRIVANTEVALGAGPSQPPQLSVGNLDDFKLCRYHGEGQLPVFSKDYIVVNQNFENCNVESSPVSSPTYGTRSYSSSSRSRSGSPWRKGHEYGTDKKDAYRTSAPFVRKKLEDYVRTESGRYREAASGSNVQEQRNKKSPSLHQSDIPETRSAARKYVEERKRDDCHNNSSNSKRNVYRERISMERKQSFNVRSKSRSPLRTQNVGSKMSPHKSSEHHKHVDRKSRSPQYFKDRLDRKDHNVHKTFSDYYRDKYGGYSSSRERRRTSKGRSPPRDEQLRSERSTYRRNSRSPDRPHVKDIHPRHSRSPHRSERSGKIQTRRTPSPRRKYRRSRSRERGMRRRSTRSPYREKRRSRSSSRHRERSSDRSRRHSPTYGNNRSDRKYPVIPPPYLVPSDYMDRSIDRWFPPQMYGPWCDPIRGPIHTAPGMMLMRPPGVEFYNGPYPMAPRPFRPIRPPIIYNNRKIPILNVPANSTTSTSTSAAATTKDTTCTSDTVHTVDACISIMSMLGKQGDTGGTANECTGATALESSNKMDEASGETDINDPPVTVTDTHSTSVSLVENVDSFQDNTVNNV